MILAIDIGGTFIKFGLVDDDFKTSPQSKVSTPTTLDDFWLTLEHIVSYHEDIISGISIACPGEINSKHGLIFKGGLIPYLTAIPLGSRLTKTFQLPVRVINDADAAALAEARYGSLKDLDCGASLGFRYGCWFRTCLTKGLDITTIVHPISASSKSPKHESNLSTLLPVGIIYAWLSKPC